MYIKDNILKYITIEFAPKWFVHKQKNNSDTCILGQPSSDILNNQSIDEL